MYASVCVYLHGCVCVCDSHVRVPYARLNLHLYWLCRYITNSACVNSTRPITCLYLKYFCNMLNRLMHIGASPVCGRFHFIFAINVISVGIFYVNFMKNIKNSNEKHVKVTLFRRRLSNYYTN